jgi:UDP-glucuronate 4-epimerase
MKFLVTGAAGFIGFHTSKRLLEEGHDVIGLDNVNDYYSVELKNSRLELLNDFETFKLYRDDLADIGAVAGVFKKEQPERVIHLGAQAGVRYSLNHPHAYIQSNVLGTLNILEGCRHNEVEHLVFASSSSVYGLNAKYPFSVSDSVNHPVSLYGATKMGNESMAHSYAHLFKLPVTGLRFFTVYGPWGRPDMAYFIFTRKILDGKPIDVFNRGDMVRDFTYIDDIVEGVVRVVMKAPEPDTNWDDTQPDPASSSAPYRVYNIGSNAPVKLMDFIQEIEKNLGKKAQLNLLPFQLGDFHKSHADVSGLIEDFGYHPKFDVQIGVKNFVDWYRSYYKK